MQIRLFYCSPRIWRATCTPLAEDNGILERIRQLELKKVAKECLDKFKTLGLSAQEAGSLLMRLGESEENT